MFRRRARPPTVHRRKSTAEASDTVAHLQPGVRVGRAALPSWFRGRHKYVSGHNCFGTASLTRSPLSLLWRPAPDFSSHVGSSWQVPTLPWTEHWNIYPGISMLGGKTYTIMMVTHREKAPAPGESSDRSISHEGIFPPAGASFDSDSNARDTGNWQLVDLAPFYGSGDDSLRIEMRPRRAYESSPCHYGKVHL